MHFYRGCFSEDVDVCSVERALVKIGCVFYRACFGKDVELCPVECALVKMNAFVLSGLFHTLESNVSFIQISLLGN